MVMHVGKRLQIVMFKAHSWLFVVSFFLELAMFWVTAEDFV